MFELRVREFWVREFESSGRREFVIQIATPDLDWNLGTANREPRTQNPRTPEPQNVEPNLKREHEPSSENPRSVNDTDTIC
jgi:hypothetical protein